MATRDEINLTLLVENLQNDIQSFQSELNTNDYPDFKSKVKELSLDLEKESDICAKNEAKCKGFRDQFDELCVSYKHTLLANAVKVKANKIDLVQEQSRLDKYKFPYDECQKNIDEKLRQFKFGETRLDKSHHHVLLLGMTGVGKSLLINNMVNYIYGVRYEDTFRFEVIVESDEKKERGEGFTDADSMTSWITSYTFHWQEGFRIPYSLTIIDTPGFGDTRGVKYDALIVNRLKNFFHDKSICPTQELTSIGFLIQASQTRITAEQKYVYDQVLSVLGIDMKENIFLILTFADSQLAPAIKTAEVNMIPYCKIFKFNNSALYAPNNDEMSKLSWQFGYTSMKAYFDSLSEMQPKSLALTKEVLNERECLQIHLTTLQKNISDGIATLKLLEKRSREIIELKGELANNRHNKVKKETFRCDLKTIDHSITNCCRCNFTCHNPCKIKGDNKKNCISIKNDYCVACPGKCNFDVHRNGTEIFVYTQIQVEETIEEMMRELSIDMDNPNAKKVALRTMLERYQSEKDELMKAITEAYDCSKRLEEIALRPHCLTKVDYIELLIKSEQRNNRVNKMDRINQLNDLKVMAENLDHVRGNTLPQILSDYENEVLDILKQTF